MKAVRFENYGDIDELRVVEIAKPQAGPGQVVVAVKAAGLNPGEAAIRAGLLHDVFPAAFPSGQGTDFAGIVDEVGEGVHEWSPGDEVAGWATRSSHAEFVVVPSDQLVRKPDGIGWETAGSISVTGPTAFAALRAVQATEGDTIAVSAAAGGVGVLVSQLAVLGGLTVIGTASEQNHDFLRSLGVIPVEYGEGVVERIRAAAPDGVDAFIDCYGHGNVEYALELGVAPQRIDTIADFDAVERHGVKAEGSAQATTQAVLTELLGLISEAKITVPIDGVFPIDEVRSAYRDLEDGHARGKYVLGMDVVEYPGEREGERAGTDEGSDQAT
ncbi:NADP-dependent oxidoreductase [Frigoribacterium sp. CFBP9039]|uniref:NADP-dependent oxidoreductase n=1 Tax=Frigoribacterium sp. CFBP9029 TaxID=3096541 RepID=UPI002A6A9E44|nr:NADP-dependent oxidoreductase [Frigoribacterium sp. CFBP9039]MDY0944808.1 NADP-dependent oxidoreductase [Frigoribacterium sp. CFBP9039]